MFSDVKGLGNLQAMLADPNIHFPTHPRLVQDLHVFQMPEGLGIQFRGGDADVLIRGNYADVVFAYLFPVLDGSRTLDDIVKNCPDNVPRIEIFRILALMHTKGLLTGDDHEDLGPLNLPQKLSDETLRRQLLFWGRNLGITRHAGSGTEVQRRLERVRLILLGTGLFGAATYDVLVRSGCNDILVSDWDDDGMFLKALSRHDLAPTNVCHLRNANVSDCVGQLNELSEGTDFLVAATRNAPRKLFSAINQIRLNSQLPWLPANFTGTTFEIGPYIRPGQSACYTCMELRQDSVQDFAVEQRLFDEQLSQPRAPGRTPPIGESVCGALWGASIVAAEVIRIVTRVSSPMLLNAVASLSPLTGKCTTSHILRVPRCPSCYRGMIQDLSFTHHDDSA